MILRTIRGFVVSPISATVTGARSVAQEWMAVPPGGPPQRQAAELPAPFSRIVEFLILLPNKLGWPRVRLRRRDLVRVYRIMFWGPWRSNRVKCTIDTDNGRKLLFRRENQ